MNSPENFESRQQRTVSVVAIRFNGSSSQAAEIHRWVEGGNPPGSVVHTRNILRVIVKTIHGDRTLARGDYAVQTSDGFVVMEPDEFESSYEIAEEL